MGLFIVFEGGEGSGKSTQAALLWRRLKKAGVNAELTYEPGGTQLGKKIRPALLGNHQRLSPMAELFLFAASRAQLVSEVIRPSLSAGKIVICDRFTDSTVAYQGYGQGIDVKTIDKINRLATLGLKPDLTILLDMSPEIGLRRRPNRSLDRFEREELEFHRCVREGYQSLAAKHPRRWLVIDATLPKAQIARIIWAKVSPKLGIGATRK